MEYTDIEVIECNKAQSIGASDINSNNALFTNKIGKNIVLQEGDTVNVEYSFINQKGCGGSTIEIEGKDLGVEQFFSYIVNSTEGIYRSVDIKEFDGDKPYMKYPSFDTLSREQVIRHTYIEKSYMLRDDEINVVQTFYKSLNCENYHFLPRCFLIDNTLTTDGTGDKAFEKNLSQPQIDKDLSDNPITHGSQRVVRLNSDCICREDYMDLPYEMEQSGENNAHMIAYVPKTDNSRFTILCRDYVVIDPTFRPADYDPLIENGNRITPAWRKYNIYGLLNTLKVDKGYNSPGNIANEITQQFQEKEETIKYYIGDIGASQIGKLGDKLTERRVVSTTTDTRTYKALNCSCTGNFNSAGYTAFMTDKDTSANTYAYESAYEFIGCKRPRLAMFGRAAAEFIEGVKGDPTIDISNKYAGNYAVIKNSIPHVNAGVSSIITSWEYEDGNLEVLQSLFKEQGKYPELFNKVPPRFQASKEPYLDNLAFLHTNQRSTIETYTLGGVSTNTQTWLGDDGMNPLQAPTTSYEGFVDLYSVPVFFYCDRSKIDTYDTGQSTQFMCYGFATKSELIDGKYWIVLHPELSGGLSDLITNGNDWVVNERLLGWDCTFSGYSSVFIGLNSGYKPYSYSNSIVGTPGVGISSNRSGIGSSPTSSAEPFFTNKIMETGGMISKTYVGSTNAALSFLSNGHFGWSYLHEPERKGQDYNAGSIPEKTGTTEAIPIEEDASTEVYKINKVLNYYVFAPDYCPYIVETNYYPQATLDDTQHGFKNITHPNDPNPDTEAVIPVDLGTKENIKQLNMRIEEWSIMDSHGGVFLDLGNSFTESIWDSGLLGILGFTYRQYNPKIINSKNNTLARITYDNIYNLEQATTNAEIIETETNNYIMNRWGGIQYTTQLPTSIALLSLGREVVANKWGAPNTPWTYTGTVTAPPYGTGVWTQYLNNTTPITVIPIIVETTSSLIITAQELPRKMLKPYFTIRSDIIMDNKYYGGNSVVSRGRGGGISLPVVSVVNKENGDGDFYFSVQSPLQFTITKQTNLSCITTSIHDPDGSLATVDNECCIVYKISRTRKRDPNIIEEIIGNLNKK